MKNRLTSIMLVSFLVIGGFVSFITYESDIVSADTIYVGSGPENDTASIQDAIDNYANDGDTIFVYSDTYYENVVVNKAVNLIGEDRDTATVDGGGTGEAIYVTVNWVNITGFTVTNTGPMTQKTALILNNVQNCRIVNNNADSGDGVGIILEFSSYNLIGDNRISSNNNDGLRLGSGSHYNTIANNTIWNNVMQGIVISGGNNNQIINNTISFNNIFLSYSMNTYIVNNTMFKCGISMSGADPVVWNTHSIDTSNTVSGKPVFYWKNQNGGTIPPDAGQVILADCTNIKIENQNVTNGSSGIQLGFSNNNYIANNTASFNNRDGIHLYYSEYNTLTNNTTNYNDGNGVYFYNSSYNTLTNNNMSNNFNGIIFSRSSHNTVTSNDVISNLDKGIGIHSSGNSNTVRNNNVLDNRRGISPGAWDNVINNKVSNNRYGIRINVGFNNNITNNEVSNNSHGIYITSSSIENNIIKNIISNNSNGILIISSSIENNIIKNIISNNQNGIYITSSSNNNIYHNNIIDNLVQGYDDTNNSNQWDDGYPSGGNYWSDFDEAGEGAYDDYQGPNQDDPTSGDGIVDNGTIGGGGKNPYVIDSYSQDNYPLINSVDTSPPLITNLQPIDGSIINDNTPIISADYSDPSGINVSSVILKVDDIDVTVSSIVTADGVSYIPTPALSDGIHTVYLEVKDNAGNLATATWSFTVDTTPPTITNLLPPDASITNDNISTISADYNDLSGINVNTVVLKVDGKDVTFFATVTTFNVSYIPIPPLSDGIHTVYLEVMDTVGNLATVTWSFTIDTIPPTITNLQPPDSSISNNNTPMIGADYSDPSGIDVSSVVLEVDGVNVTSFAMVTVSDVSYIPGTALSDGIHTVYLEVMDNAGNLATATWSFTVEATPPTITNLQPPNASSTNNNTPTIGASYNDPSGINVSSVLLEVDGIDETISAIVTANNVTYIPGTALSDGIHTVYLEVRDNVGNLATATWSFTVDTLPPVIANLQPPDTSTTNDNTPTIGADYSDLSGINVGSVLLEVDGIDVTISAIVTAGGVTYLPGTALSDGIHTVYLEVRDNVGNLATATWSFTVDATPPIITNLQPPDLSTTNNSTPTISADYSDPSGINVSSVLLEVDGMDVTSSATVTASGVSYIPGMALSDGIHTVYLEVQDIYGNLATASWSFTVDTTPPGITNLQSPDASITNNSTPVIGANYNDPSGINVSSVLLVVDGIDETFSATVTVSGVTYIPVIALPDGIHTVYLEVKDNYDNLATATWSFTVDTLPPMITNLQPPDASTTNDNTPTISANYSDPSGINASSVVLKVDSVNVTSSATVTASGVSYIPGMVLSDGIHTVYLEVKDNVDNLATATWSFIVDTTPPTTTISPDRYTVKLGTLFTLTVTDGVAGCGVNYTQYKIDDGNWLDYIAPFSITTYGYHNITYRSVDNLGNIEDENTLSIYVPKVPITTIIVGSPQYGTTPRYVNYSTQFSFSVIDYSGTGYNTYYYIDTSPLISYIGPFTVSTEGTHTIYYYSTDNLGNIENTNEFDIIVDNTPPTTTITFGDPNYVSGDTWVTSDTLFTIDATDGGLIPVGIDDTKYRMWNGGIWTTWNTCTSGFSLGLNEGTSYVEFYSVDRLGNAESIINRTYIVDDTPPTTTISVGDPKYKGDPSDIWNVSSATTFTLSTIDDGVGLDYLEYRIWDNGSWSDWYIYAEGFKLGSDNGTKYVEWFSVDYLGNKEMTHNETYFVDNIPPETNYLLLLEPDNTEAQISLIPNDIGSGVDFTKYRVDSGDWITYSDTFVINESGEHVIYFWSTDKLGNTEETNEFSVLVEEPGTTPPRDEEKETNSKPLIALIFSIILLIVGSYVSYKRPLGIKWEISRNRRLTWLFIVLPFVIAEAITGIISILTGLLSVPPLFGAGMAIDLAILLAGLIAFMMVYRKLE